MKIPRVLHRHVHEFKWCSLLLRLMHKVIPCKSIFNCKADKNIFHIVISQANKQTRLRHTLLLLVFIRYSRHLLPLSRVMFIGHGKNRIRHPSAEVGVVAELLIELRVVLQHRGHDALERFVVLNLRILLI